ncbi:MAG: hypothetical protein J2P37_33095 [Ktedonobacteraceae bacterium]|nr:hypothetical protein [Ktedonobacteraceae bacterium]
MSSFPSIARFSQQIRYQVSCAHRVMAFDDLTVSTERQPHHLPSRGLEDAGT